MWPQDFIPQEELAKLLAKSGSETAKAQAAALEEVQKIQADNVGHRMLQAMGWREGQGLGASASGIAAPIAAAAAKQPIDKGGLGARVCPLCPWIPPAVCGFSLLLCLGSVVMRVGWAHGYVLLPPPLSLPSRFLRASYACRLPTKSERMMTSLRRTERE